LDSRYVYFFFQHGGFATERKNNRNDFIPAQLKRCFSIGNLKSLMVEGNFPTMRGDVMADLMHKSGLCESDEGIPDYSEPMRGHVILDGSTMARHLRLVQQSGHLLVEYFTSKL
jgi:hypothetical protein